MRAKMDGLRSGDERKVGYWESGTASKFDPERWFINGKYDPLAGPSLPFGQGQRGCFGKNLAVGTSVRTTYLVLIISFWNFA